MSVAPANPAEPSLRGYLPPLVYHSDKIKELYDRRFDADFKPTSWAYRRAALVLAKTHLQRFRVWLTEQTNGEYLYGRRLEFLLDTLNFIQTGKRKMGVNNWFELLEENPAPDRYSVPRNAKEQLFSFEIPYNSIVDLLVQWTTHTGGFDDMVCTLNILFGSGKKATLPRRRVYERLTVRHLEN